MCVVSNVGDYWGDRWRPYVEGPGAGGIGTGQAPQLPNITISSISREEFEALRKEVLEMKEMMKQAQDLDRKMQQPDCEMESKLKILRAVADAVGVKLDDILPGAPHD